MAVEMENERTLSDYISIVKRRWLLILLVSTVSSIVASMYIFTLEPKYYAEGFITINSPDISNSLIGGDELSVAKYVGEHLDKVKQKVLSRDNLVRLDEKYDLFPAIIKPSWIADAVEESIRVESDKKSRNGGDWGPQVTVGLTIGFEHSDPQVTFDVVNDIISQLLDQNVKDRRMRATETAGFLTAELTKFQNELDVVEDKVAAYKQKHSNSLPEHQQLHMTTLDQLRTALKGLDIEAQSTQEELRYLDVELATAKAALNNANSDDGFAAEASKLDIARAELERAMVLYKDTHPTIRILKRKVALLEQQESVPTVVKTKKVDVAGELAIAKIQSQIEAAKSRLASISQEKKASRGEMQRVKQQIINIPQVESGLASLLRDYENAKRKYDEVKAKQVNAKVAEGLELSNKTERLVLLESPEYPEYNQNMRKAKAIPLGLIGSLGLGFGFAFLLELLDKRVRGQGALISVVNSKPLVVIPYINTQAELRQKKNMIRLASIVLFILIALIVGLAVTHFFVTPLDSFPMLESVLET